MGVGGVGGVVAASLAAGGCDLTLIARGACFERLSSGGLEVHSYDGERVHCRPQVTHASEAASAGEMDYVLWATKAHQMAESAPSVAALLGTSTRVVPLQNGLPFWFFHGFGAQLEGQTFTSSDATCWQAVHPSRVIGCVSFVAGEVDHSQQPYGRWLSKWPASKSSLAFGELAARDGAAATGSVGLLANLIEGSQPPLISVQRLADGDIRRAVLEKVKVNASINPLSALACADCGQLTESPRLVEKLREVCADLDRLIGALEPRVRLSTTTDDILRRYQGQHGLMPSMLQDLMAGRTLEREALVSALVALGARLGVSMPHLKQLDTQLEAFERRQRERPQRSA